MVPCRSDFLCVCLCDCSSSEQKFLEASMAYSAGRPIMNDAEYDALKNDLKQSNSLVAIGVGSGCSAQCCPAACSKTGYIKLSTNNSLLASAFIILDEYRVLPPPF